VEGHQEIPCVEFCSPRGGRFQDMCDIEKANAVVFLEKIRSSRENTLEGINGIERGLFTVEEVNNYTTNILRGGLTPGG
jgi:hypothetical protein